MDNKEKWNLIVEQYSQYFTFPESKIQEIWESYCSELLNYKKILREIDSQRSIQIGSSERIIPDIILRIDNSDVFDIELKQYSLHFDEKFEKQLISYLNQTHIDVGMIVCRSIYLYSYDYRENNVIKMIIPFEVDNEDGIALVGMISRENFGSEEIKNYVSRNNSYKKNIEDIRNQINSQLLVDLVRSHFSESYTEQEIDKALEVFSFSANKRNRDRQVGIQEYLSDEKTTNQNKGNSVVSRFDIGTAVVKWCCEKRNEGLILYDEGNTNQQQTLIRFTTRRIEDYLPPDTNKGNGRSPWQEHDCFYEVNLRDNNCMKMWLALKNRHNSYSKSKINALLEHESIQLKDDNWGWKTCWNTFSVKQSSLINEELVFKYLDEQFDELMNKEARYFAKS